MVAGSFVYPSLSKKAILVVVILFPLLAAAEHLKDDERKKRHYVSRTYHATDGMLAICPGNRIEAFKDTLNQLKTTYPELIRRLVKNSKYYQRAVTDFADVIAEASTQSQEQLARRYQAIDDMWQSMLSSEKGKKSIEQAIEILPK